MEYQDLLYKSEQSVATITINRPDKHNAFRLQTLDELAHAFERADADQNVGVIVLTGSGEKAFCSGGDVNSEADFTRNKAWLYNRRLLHLSSTMRNTGKPVIARIDGWCVGGGNELNMLCDLAVASDRSTFGQAGARVASVPIWYGTQLLPRLVGERRAKEVVMLCHRYSAAEAERMGWINKVVPHQQLDTAVAEWCQELLEKSPHRAAHCQAASQLRIRHALRLCRSGLPHAQCWTPRLRRAKGGHVRLSRKAQAEFRTVPLTSFGRE